MGIISLAGISERIERELEDFGREFDKPPLSAIPSPYREIVIGFLLRKGKRLRPTLFLIGYGGYASQPARNLYRSAIALEFLHDFILIHDDIVDHARRRGDEPAVHERFDQEHARKPAARFSGENLAMIVGDLLYAAGVNLFLSVEEAPDRKARALEHLTKAAVFTACGELKELLDTLDPLRSATPEEISQTSEWKTAYYSFACPLVTGATLAGAGESDIETLFKYALSVGLAFQIRDDILDITSGALPGEGEMDLGDLREGKLTLPLWYALSKSSRHDQARLAAVLTGRRRQSRRALSAARDIILDLGGTEYAWREIYRIAREARGLLESLTMADASRALLSRYTADLLEMPGDDSSQAYIERERAAS